MVSIHVVTLDKGHEKNVTPRGHGGLECTLFRFRPAAVRRPLEGTTRSGVPCLDLFASIAGRDGPALGEASPELLDTTRLASLNPLPLVACELCLDTFELLAALDSFCLTLLSLDVLVRLDSPGAGSDLTTRGVVRALLGGGSGSRGPKTIPALGESVVSISAGSGQSCDDVAGAGNE